MTTYALYHPRDKTFLTEGMGGTRDEREAQQFGSKMEGEIFWSTYLDYAPCYVVVPVKEAA